MIVRPISVVLEPFYLLHSIANLDRSICFRRDVKQFVDDVRRGDDYTSPAESIV